MEFMSLEEWKNMWNELA